MNIVLKEISWYPVRMQNSRMRLAVPASGSARGNPFLTLKDADVKPSALTVKPVNVSSMMMRDAVPTRLQLMVPALVTAMIPDAAALKTNKKNRDRNLDGFLSLNFYTLIIPRFSRIEKIRIAIRKIGATYFIRTS